MFKFLNPGRVVYKQAQIRIDHVPTESGTGPNRVFYETVPIAFKKKLLQLNFGTSLNELLLKVFSFVLR